MCYYGAGGRFLRKGREPMSSIVPKEKMNKKARKRMAAEKRTLWTFSPVTKMIENKKTYNRKRISRTRYDDGREILL